jgi:uncharacterized membrane protein
MRPSFPIGFAPRPIDDLDGAGSCPVLHRQSTSFGVLGRAITAVPKRRFLCRTAQLAPVRTRFFLSHGSRHGFICRIPRKRDWPEWRIARHFLLRGLLLLFLQQLIVNPAWFLGTMGSTAILQTMGGETAWINLDVLYGLGGCRIVLSLLMRANSAAIAAASVVAIAAGRIFMPAPEFSDAVFSPLARMLLVPGQTGMLLVLYPLLHWLGIAGLGLAFGKWMVRDRDGAFRWLPFMGTGCLVSFVVLRALGLGDFHAPDGGGWLAFLNITKYPPSLVFMLLTMEIDLLLLSVFSGLSSRLGRWNPLLVFGRAALFFYVLHFYFFTVIGRPFPKGVVLEGRI